MPWILRLQISDLHQNPMPSGSTVTITNAVNGQVSVLPATVQNTYPHNAAGNDDRTGGNIKGNQWSLHTVTINSLTPTNCVAAVVNTLNVTATTPLATLAVIRLH